MDIRDATAWYVNSVASPDKQISYEEVTFGQEAAVVGGGVWAGAMVGEGVYFSAVIAPSLLTALESASTLTKIPAFILAAIGVQVGAGEALLGMPDVKNAAQFVGGKYLTYVPPAIDWGVGLGNDAVHIVEKQGRKISRRLFPPAEIKQGIADQIEIGQNCMAEYATSGECTLDYFTYFDTLQYYQAQRSSYDIQAGLPQLNKRFDLTVSAAQARAAMVETGEDKRLALEKTVFVSDLKHYKKRQALLPLLMDGQGGNCEAETYFMAGFYQRMEQAGVDFGLPGYKRFVRVFFGHESVVYYNPEKDRLYDPRDNVFEDGTRTDLYSPEILVWQTLVGEGEAVSLGSKDFLKYRKNTNVPADWWSWLKSAKFRDLLDFLSNNSMVGGLILSWDQYKTSASPAETIMELNESSGKVEEHDLSLGKMEKSTGMNGNAGGKETDVSGEEWSLKIFHEHFFDVIVGNTQDDQFDLVPYSADVIPTVDHFLEVFERHIAHKTKMYAVITSESGATWDASDKRKDRNELFGEDIIARNGLLLMRALHLYLRTDGEYLSKAEQITLAKQKNRLKQLMAQHFKVMDDISRALQEPEAQNIFYSQITDTRAVTDLRCRRYSCYPSFLNEPLIDQQYLLETAGASQGPIDLSVFVAIVNDLSHAASARSAREAGLSFGQGDTYLQRYHQEPVLQAIFDSYKTVDRFDFYDQEEITRNAFSIEVIDENAYEEDFSSAVDKQPKNKPKVAMIDPRYATMLFFIKNSSRNAVPYYVPEFWQAFLNSPGSAQVLDINYPELERWVEGGFLWYDPSDFMCLSGKITSRTDWSWSPLLLPSGYSFDDAYYKCRLPGQSLAEYYEDISSSGKPSTVVGARHLAELNYLQRYLKAHPEADMYGIKKRQRSYYAETPFEGMADTVQEFLTVPVPLPQP
ncbi:MAG: hypothetical protein WC636_06325 [Candidatus Margulisiibacteriota bacterium]